MSVENVIVWLTGDFEADVVAALNQQSARYRVARRCADRGEVEASVLAGVGRIVLLDELCGIDSAFVEALHAAHALVLLVVTDTLATPSFGEDVRVERTSAHELLESLTLAIREDLRGETTVSPGVEREPEPQADKNGQMVAIWGTAGAPGRSTIAANLAHCVASLERHVTLVDADTTAPALAIMLGVEDGGSGLVRACSLQNRGMLEVTELGELREKLASRLTILTGLTQADTWQTLRSEAVAQTVEQLRYFGDVIVDIGAGFTEADPAQLSFIPSREDVNLELLQAADRRVLVAKADAVGLTRLNQALAQCKDASVDIDLVVINQVRNAASGSRSRRSLITVARSICQNIPFELIDATPAVDDAVLKATTVVETAQQSSFARSITQIASQLFDVTPVESSGPQQAPKRQTKPWWNRLRKWAEGKGAEKTAKHG
ncbi:AAA family ATPase [Gleimia hominis]|uniref:AAA family ATPase n=1 Tax=Gleimia hominis TaxID=595468 RepID=UPI0013045DA3|nr:P-loop NTPase [Gleimia hominis]WIK64781.1 P-loop NTPase [Gleimia hominis]